jgi:Type II secretion system (T2SS), protein N
VKRRSLVLTVIAGLAVFLVVMAIYLPASWVVSALPAQLGCRDVGGSAWNGECLGLRYQAATLGDATWNFAATRAVGGRLAGNVELRGSAVNARAELDTNFAGVGELRNVKLQVVLDPALLPQLPHEQRGTLSADLKRVALAAGGVLHALDGSVELRDLRQVGAQAVELGSYQATFDGKAATDGAVIGKLRDLGGPFIVDGTVKLTAPNGYLVQGYITGRTADAERTVREITLGVPPDSSGRSTFSFEGSY